MLGMWEHSGPVLHTVFYLSNLVVQFASHSEARCKICCKNISTSVVEQNIVSELYWESTYASFKCISHSIFIVGLTLNPHIPQEKHPHPGQPYRGLRLCSYLPDNREGRQVLKLLDKAFNKQLLFTVATTQDGADMVTTAFIPLKTQPDGGSRK